MRTGAAEPDRGTHTMEGASGFCNRAHVHEYTIVDEGRYFTQPPLFTGTFLLRGPLAHVAYIVLVRGICILPLFLLSTLILNVPPVTLWALAPRSWVDSLLSTKERLTVLLSTKERLTHFDCSRLMRDLCCSLLVRDFGCMLQRARLVRACAVVVPLTGWAAVCFRLREAHRLTGLFFAY